MRIQAPSEPKSLQQVLIVEDETDIREALGELLRDEGYEVSSCSNAVEAFDRLRHSTPPDLILLDLMMPEMDGWQFRVEQRRDPALASIPVIAVSADSTAKALAIDADAYLRKPIDYPKLLETIDRLLLKVGRERLEARHKELDRLTSLGTLTAGLAHEINNPLAFVSGNLSLALEQCSLIADCQNLDAAKASAKRMAQALDHVRTGTERIAGVVSSLFAFSRPETDGLVAVDARKVLDVSVLLANNEIRHRALLVRDDAELPLVLGSEARLGHVFLNLLVNAAQAIPEGRAADHQIRVSSRVRDGHVIVEVSDTGRGIPADLLGRIYDPFFSTKPVGVGMGLGLTICYSAVHSMGGELEVESEVGKGTTFRVRLQIANEAKEQPPSPQPAALVEARARRVLIIDDEPLLCELLSDVLSRKHEVTACTSSRDAVARVLAGERFDRILCDLMMPEMSGMEVYAALRERVPQQAERMVFLTGGAFTVASREFLRSVPHRRVSKPFDFKELFAVVEDRPYERASDDDAL